MRNFTLFLFLISFSFTFGQVVLNENFDTALSLPTGWTNNDIATSGELWTFETGGNAPYLGTGNTAFYTTAGFSGNYPIFNSDANGAGAAENTALESPSFDCSTLTTVVLSFKHLFVSGYGGEGHIEVFDGTQWVEVGLYSEANVTADTYTSGEIIIDVSTELAGVSNAQVRFRWVGNYSYYWALDDVTVQQPTINPPDAPTTPTPIDGAVDVPIDTSANPTLTISPFEWIAATTGDPASSFNLSLGITPSGDDIGSLTGFNSGGGVNYNWAYSTTYYWRIDAVNIAGTTQGTVWSFTTEADPNLSTDDFNIKPLSIYPNPTSDFVNIKTDMTINSVEVFNQLGQRVINLKGDSLLENTIDVKNLKNGIYLMTITSDKKKQTFKFIKE